MDGTSGQGGGVEDRELEELMVKSFIQIMMETEKTAEGKAELAQAQENDRRRRETQQQLQLQLGGDAVHIQGTNPPGVIPPSLYPTSQQQQQAYHSGLVVSQPDDYNQQQHQQPSPYSYPGLSTHQQASLSSQPQPSTIQSSLPPNTNKSHPHLQHYPQGPPQQPQQPSQPFYQQPGQHNDHNQTYDPYQQLQLQQQQQQQLQHQYQQQLIELQKQQQLQLQSQHQQLQHAYQPSNNIAEIPNNYNNIPTDLPRQKPQTAITVKHIITGHNNNNNNDENNSNISQIIPQILQNNITEYHTNNPYPLPPRSNYNHGNESIQAPNSQHLTPVSSTMTNSVSKLSHNTDTTPIDLYAHSGDVYANPDYVSSKAGPLGMSILDKSGKNGPKVIVLDHSDNEVEEGQDVNSGKYKSKKLDHVRSPSHFNNDVYPISPEAMERDMFKQEYVPHPNGSQNDGHNVSMNIHQGDTSENDRTNQYQNGTGVRNIGESIDPTAFGYPDISNNPDVLLSEPSDSEVDNPKSMANTSIDSSMSPRRLRQQNPLSYQELLQQKLQLQNELYIRQQNENQRQLNKPYSRAGHNGGTGTDETHNNDRHDIDLDRYTNVPSQLTSINEDTTIPLDSYREHLDSSMDTYRTVDPDPFGNDQNISIDIERESKINNSFLSKNENDKKRLNNHNTNVVNSKTPFKNNQRLSDQRYPMSSQNPTIKIHNASGAPSPSPAFKVTGPGYKVDVSGENIVQKRATRTNILNRAERLLDARRVHQLTDKSDSSDGDLSQVKHDDGYDEEDDDDVQELRGPRHRALRHVKHQYYDDTTSYNSSDDILNTLRFSRQGPLTKAARRARLTSFNARLHKQRRVKAALRLNNLPRTMSDDEFDSSENDNIGRYEDRYEESKLRDLSNDQRYQQDTGDDVNSLKKGRRVFFFRNGDPHYKPKQVLISSRTYQNFEKLLVDLSTIVETSTGVKFIFSWPEGKEMNSITQFQNGKYYICSSTKNLQVVDYGNSREGPWKVGKIDRQENFLFQKNGKVQSPLRKPRILTIISNLYRDSREKLILNTNSAMNFEEILNDIVNMVNIPNPPVKALYTERKPHLQVLSYSQLIRDFADHDNFIACGEELVPLELANKRPIHATANSSDGSKKGSKRTPRYVAHDDGSGSPTRSSAMTAYTDVPRGIRPDPRRRKVDSIRVDINGKTREFFPPTVYDEEDDGNKPWKKLKLEWVYGFRGRDVKQNLVVLPSTGELVYFVAAVVVLYDKKFATQKHYLGHNEEVTCLTIHPNGRFLASGQLAGKSQESGAHIRIWDGMSLSTYAVIGLGVFAQGIACVNFSERESSGGLEDNRMVTGDLLMAIDDSDRHVLSVWEWQTEKLVSKTTTTSDPVVSGCFYPFDDTIVITYGKEHIHFWRMFWEKGRKVMRDKLSGNFEDDIPKFVTSICFSPTGDVITGDSHGAILVWTRDNNSVFSVSDTLSIHSKRAHKKSVASLCMLGDGTLLSGGGNEIKAWDTINDYSLVKERMLPDYAGHVRSIVPITTGGLDGSIYVSTTKNKVLEGSLQLKFKSVIQGHVEELWAVESHPLEQTFVTAGHDQTVAKWSAVSHAAVWRVDIEKPCVSISIDPKGRLVALGTTGGKVIILNSYNGIQLTTLLAGPNQVNALSFSPDGKQLAVGTYDGTILIFYTQSEGYKFFNAQTSTLKHNNVFIMHMDWSVDCKFLQVVLGDYDVIYWDLSIMKRIKSPRSLRDVKWATHNCPIGHPIIGPWHNLDRGDVINVVCRSQYRDLMVTGDNKGRLRLYKWPCSLPKAGYRNVKVYSSNVTTATFTSDDSYLITSGGNDAALMQFSVLDPVNTR